MWTNQIKVCKSRKSRCICYLCSRSCFPFRLNQKKNPLRLIRPTCGSCRTCTNGMFKFKKLQITLPTIPVAPVAPVTSLTCLRYNTQHFFTDDPGSPGCSCRSYPTCSSCTCTGCSSCTEESFLIRKICYKQFVKLFLCREF